jgi:L-iditol 2-dehydrogenase
VYKRVGVTAGFEPAGGGFAQYVRAMDWIVERGIERIPEGVSFDQACWVEPVNTCLKGVELLGLRRSDVVAVLGQGPIGLIFTMLVSRRVSRVVATDAIAYRRQLSAEFGAEAFDPRAGGIEERIRDLTDGRGADAVILATNVKGLVEQAIHISRPGARVLLFAQTSASERIELYVDLQAESARLVFSGELPLERIISHRLALHAIAQAIDIARHPDERSLKVVIRPQESR